jgi:hypothetical protein
MARHIGEWLRVDLPNRNSNECVFEGMRAVIKSAHEKTTSIGVSYQMLERLDLIIAAIEQANGSYEVYKYPAARFRDMLRPTESKGPSKGRVGLVNRSDIVEHGEPIGTFNP